MAGTLFLVATPIGNLEDISLRALRTLKEADRIACEDTRHSRKLLTHYEIRRPLVSFHAHNAHERVPELIAALETGENIALVTDAGMPGISDPGLELVAACHAAKLPVVVIPGASAVTMALVLAGEEESRFVFEGFLPTDRTRTSRLALIKGEVRTIILYEAPHRLLKTLMDLITLGEPERRITICRELTKLHEQVWRGSLQSAFDYFSNTAPRGEFTLVLQGAVLAVETWSEEQLQAALVELVGSGFSRSEATRQLAQRTGISRKLIYQLSLSIERGGGSTEESVSMNEFDAG